MKFSILNLSFLTLFLAAGFIFSGCKKDEVIYPTTTSTAPKPPVVSATNAAGAITSTTATSGGTVSSSVALTATGVVWSSSSIQPTLADNFTNDGTLAGSYVSNMTGLSPNTLYYVKAYATNVSGTTYGPRISFTTLP